MALFVCAALLAVWWAAHVWYRNTLFHELRGDLLAEIDPYGNALTIDQRRLVNRVLPDDQVEEYVRQTALTIAQNAPLTMAAAKTVIDELIAPAGKFDASREAIARCMGSADYAEGRRAFMEKRKPKFEGR